MISFGYESFIDSQLNLNENICNFIVSIVPTDDPAP